MQVLKGKRSGFQKHQVRRSHVHDTRHRGHVVSAGVSIGYGVYGVAQTINVLLAFLKPPHQPFSACAVRHTSLSGPPLQTLPRVSCAWILSECSLCRYQRAVRLAGRLAFGPNDHGRGDALSVSIQTDRLPSFQGVELLKGG